MELDNPGMQSIYEKETMILNLNCLAIIYEQKNPMEVNPEGKPGVEPRRRLDVNTNDFTATLVAKPFPNAIPVFLSLRKVRPRERVCSLGCAQSPYTIP